MLNLFASSLFVSFRYFGGNQCRISALIRHTNVAGFEYGIRYLPYQHCLFKQPIANFVFAFNSLRCLFLRLSQRALLAFMCFRQFVHIRLTLFAVVASIAFALLISTKFISTVYILFSNCFFAISIASSLFFCNNFLIASSVQFHSVCLHYAANLISLRYFVRSNKTSLLPNFVSSQLSMFL